MPEIARGNTADTVDTNHGCTDSTTTDEASETVFVGGIGVHTQNHACTSHIYTGSNCGVSHAPVISTGSSTVKANSLGVARVGDAYKGGETVSSGHGFTFAGD